MATATLLRNSKKAHHISHPALNQSLGQKYYNSRIWHRLRSTKLLEQPLCERCLEQGRTTLATDVHHITPFLTYLDEESRWEAFKDYDNLMSLCEQCHNEIHKEMRKRNNIS